MKRKKQLPNELRPLLYNGFEKLERESHPLDAAKGIIWAAITGGLFFLTVYYLRVSGFYD